MPRRTPFRRALKLLVGLMVSVGLLFFLSGLFFTLTATKARTVRFPLADPDNIIADREGNVYVNVAFYRRIQQYDRDGVFLRGWPVQSHVWFELDANDNLMVRSYCETRVYSHDGQLLFSEDHDLITAPQASRYSCRTPAGDTLHIRSPILNPHIDVTRRDGSIGTFVAQPWYVWPVSGPMPEWLLMIGGLLLLARLNRDERSRTKGSTSPATLPAAG